MTTPRQGKSGRRSARNERAGNGRYSLARNINGLGNSAQQALRAGREAMTSAYGMASSGLSRSLPRARAMVPHTPRNLQRMVDNNPLLIGVIGIGVGLLLGALMPTSVSSLSPQPPARKSSRGRRSGVAKRRRSATRRGKPRPSAQAGKTVEPAGCRRSVNARSLLGLRLRGDDDNSAAAVEIHDWVPACAGTTTRRFVIPSNEGSNEAAQQRRGSSGLLIDEAFGKGG